MRSIHSLATGAFVLVGIVAAAYGQISQASLQGTVTDNTGAVVPNASIQLKNIGTSAIRTTTANSAGEYILPDLNPGEYSLTIGYSGFKSFVVSSLTVHTGENATINAALEVGAANQTITIDAAVPLVQTASAEVTHLVPPSQVADLPLNGRNFWELTQLTPGATFIPRAQTAQFNGSEIRARSVNVNVNGQSSIFTGWSLDGANVTNFELGGTLIEPNVDAIQEFAVGAGNMSPEFGHTPNMINASLKSGTNSFHGNLFEFLRNDKMDARNFFLPSPIPLKRNQFGGTIGGPIWKNKIFFFADYQGTRLRQGTTFNYVVPSVAERTGNFAELTKKLIDPLNGTPFPGNMIPASRIAPQATNFLPYLPLPNLLQGVTSRTVLSTATPIDTDEGDIRIDGHATEKDAFMARYSIANNNEFNPNPFPALQGTTLHSSAQDTALMWTHMFGPSLLNVAQVSYYNSPFLFGVVLPGFDLAQVGVLGFEDPALTPVKSFPNISLSGYQGFQGSPSDQRPKHITVKNYQYSDSMTWNKGRHEIKFGFEWLHRRDAFSIGQNSVGNFSFVGTYTGDAFGDFLLGYPDNATRSPFQTLQGDYGDFLAWHFSDNFRVRPGLTINLGLRYEINSFFNGILDTRSGFDFQTGKVIVPSGIPPNAQPLTPQLLQLFADRIEFTDSLGLPKSVSPSTKLDFAPRIGIAWNPLGSQKTAVRAGYGIFYVYPDTNLINNTVVTVPFVDNLTLFNDRPPLSPTRTFGDFFQGAPIASPNPNPGHPCPFGMVLISCDTPSITSALAHLQQQYTQQWNLSLQRQLASRVALTVAYVGSGTVHLQQGIRRNDPPPGPGAIQARRPFPQWGPIGLQEWGGKGNYNGLQTEIEFREWHGLTLMGSYVYAKCMDNGTDEGSAPATQLIGANYAPCDFDQKHTSSVSFNYQLPFGKGKQFLNSGGVVNAFVGGWQLAGVETVKSGLPFTPVINGDRANTGVGGQRPNVIGVPIVLGTVACWFYTSSNPACPSVAPNTTDAFAVPAQYTYGNSGRNILRGDNLVQTDLTLMREFGISEARRLEFRAEFFNAFNHTVFANPGTSINLSSGGQVSSTLNSARIIELALKFYF
ncbi:MAG TPA: carboxypeptidase-like regulatory domain-containing protein [Bryobacteraceae bacterium]|nr:carboxypeptidase-like regulatory domain-containing protein [Bryobacteraceae bacterium]